MPQLARKLREMVETLRAQPLVIPSSQSKDSSGDLITGTDK
jgi:hypothetical protein